MSRAVQSPTFTRKRLAPLALGVGIALATAGCGAGMNTQTESQVAGVNGASGEAGQIQVRDVQVAFPSSGSEYPAGCAAPLVLTIANNGGTADELVSVSSSAAGDSAISGQTTIPARFSVSSGLDVDDQQGNAFPTPTPSSPTPTTTGGAPAPSPSTTPSASCPRGAEPTDKTTPSPSAGPATPGRISVTLTGLNVDFKPGLTINVTFRFSHSGAITLPVPMGAPSDSRLSGVPTSTPTTAHELGA